MNSAVVIDGPVGGPPGGETETPVLVDLKISGFGSNMLKYRFQDSSIQKDHLGCVLKEGDQPIDVGLFYLGGGLGKVSPFKFTSMSLDKLPSSVSHSSSERSCCARLCRLLGAAFEASAWVNQDSRG